MRAEVSRGAVKGRPPTRRVLKGGYLMTSEIEGDPVVDRRPADACPPGHFIDGAPLGDQQYGLHPLKGVLGRSAL
jgi:hypothetical protein